eukprot:Gb_07449 [translate_table: standard]
MAAASSLRNAFKLNRVLGIWNSITPHQHFLSRQYKSPAFFQGVKNWHPAASIRPQKINQWGVSIPSQAVRCMATSRRVQVNRTLDIGARARQNQNRRLWTYALSFSAIAGFIIIVLNSFQDYLVFYITPTDAMERFARDPSKNKFRLGGLVLEGSVVQPASTTETEFVVTDLVTDILVRYKGMLPDLFREGHSVVVEGFVRPFASENNNNNSNNNNDTFTPLSSDRAVTEKARGNGCYFSAVEVLAKHDEKYMPREVAAAIEKNRAAIEAAHPSMSNSQEQSQKVHS